MMASRSGTSKSKIKNQKSKIKNQKSKAFSINRNLLDGRH
jgi:hypothetical protein